MNQKEIIDRPLKLDIKPNDCKLLITVKEALKGYTTVKFRKLFSDNEDTAYENMLRSIEKPPRGRITIARYLMLMERINMFKNASSVMEKYNITKRSVGIKEIEKGEGIVYSVPKTVEYEITVQEIPEHKNFTAMCQTAIIDGKSYPLHNEITFTFKIIDGKVDVIWGWHIGTEDFTFSKEEGDNCEEYVEEYHPGLLDQLKTKLKEMKYI